MANAKVDSKGDRTEMLGDREIVIPANANEPHYWKETGEHVSPQEREFYAKFAGGSVNFKGERKQNQEIFFWTPEVTLKEGERPETNPIQGFVYEVFKRPNSFKDVDDGADDAKEEGASGARLAAWIFTTHTTHVKTLGKKTKKVGPGNWVWVDLNQATMRLVQIATPRKGESGALEGVVQVGIEPKFKEAFQAKGAARFAWRMDLYGGWNSPSFKKLDSKKAIDDTIVNVFGAPPSAFMTMQDAANLLGIDLSDDEDSAPSNAPALLPGA